MSQHYSDPDRASDPHALPDREVFYLSHAEIVDADMRDDEGEPLAEGWYWWACFPGCMPDGDPCGPFDTEADAIAGATGEPTAAEIHAGQSELAAAYSVHLDREIARKRGES